MRSVADEIRDEQIRDVLAMSPAQRIELAVRLNEEGLRFFMATNNLDRASALAEIRKQRSAGRVPSHCMDTLP